jgi:hypothetical protein
MAIVAENIQIEGKLFSVNSRFSPVEGAKQLFCALPDK